MRGLESPMPDHANHIVGNPHRRLKRERHALLINRELTRRMIGQIVLQLRRIIRLPLGHNPPSTRGASKLKSLRLLNKAQRAWDAFFDRCNALTVRLGIRDLNDNPALRKQPVDRVLSEMIEFGGPLLYHGDEDQQRSFGSTCRKFQQFLTERAR